MGYVKNISCKSLRVDFEVSSTYSSLSSKLLRLQKILDMTTQESQKGEMNMCEKALPATAQNLYLYMKAHFNEQNELTITILERR